MYQRCFKVRLSQINFKVWLQTGLNKFGICQSITSNIFLIYFCSKLISIPPRHLISPLVCSVALWTLISSENSFLLSEMIKHAKQNQKTPCGTFLAFDTVSHRHIDLSTSFRHNYNIRSSSFWLVIYCLASWPFFFNQYKNVFL